MTLEFAAGGESLGTAPIGEFWDVSVGFDHACALDIDNHVHCRGNDADGRATAPPGQFASVSAGAGRSCAVETTPPSGEFVDVSAGAITPVRSGAPMASVTTPHGDLLGRRRPRPVELRRSGRVSGGGAGGMRRELPVSRLSPLALAWYMALIGSLINAGLQALAKAVLRRGGNQKPLRQASTPSPSGIRSAPITRSISSCV
jgi:hypothetical protein